MFFLCRREGLTRRAIQRSPPGQSSALLISPVISAMSLSSSGAAILADAGLPRAGRDSRDAASSLAVIIEPQVNSTVLRGEDSVSRCFTRSWLAPAPSIREPPKARNEAESQLTDPRKHLKPSSLNCGG